MLRPILNAVISHEFFSFVFRWRFTYYLGIFIYGLTVLWDVSTRFHQFTYKGVLKKKAIYIIYIIGTNYMYPNKIIIFHSHKFTPCWMDLSLFLEGQLYK